MTSDNLKNEFTSIKKSKVYEEIAKQIENLIDKRQLKPGHRLPPERELSDIFKVSRHSIREAFRFLENGRIIKSFPGSGTYVAASKQDVTLDLIAGYLIEKTDKLAEIFEMRRIIEPQVARLAARNADEDNLKALQRMLLKNQSFIEGKQRDFETFVEVDHELHQIIAYSTKNSLIPKVIERLSDIFTETRSYIYQSEIRIGISARGHVKIIRSILDSQEEEAFVAMEKHLLDVEKIIIDHFVSTSLE